MFKKLWCLARRFSHKATGKIPSEESDRSTASIYRHLNELKKKWPELKIVEGDPSETTLVLGARPPKKESKEDLQKP